MKCINIGEAAFKRNNESTSSSVLDLSYVSQHLTMLWHVGDYHLGGSRHFHVTLDNETSANKDTSFFAENKLKETLGELVLDPDVDHIEEKLTCKIEYATYAVKIDFKPKYWGCIVERGSG